MAAKLAKVAGLIRFESEDDEQIKQALGQHMDDEAAAAMAGGDFPYADHAAKLEDLARAYEDAQVTEEGDDEPPHVTMRKMAAKFRKMAAPPVTQAAGPGAEEQAKQEMARQFAQRLNVSLPPGLTSAQMFDALGAAAVPTSSLPQLVAAQVSRELEARDARRAREETAVRARQLVDRAVAAGYPANQADALLRAASDPATFDAVEAGLRPLIRSAGGQDPVLFQQTVFAGAPAGLPVRDAAEPYGPDVKIVRNELATWVEEGGRFSKMAQDLADSAEPAKRAEVDALLSETERSHPGLRLVAANRLLRQKRPDLWTAAEEPHLMGLQNLIALQR